MNTRFDTAIDSITSWIDATRFGRASLLAALLELPSLIGFCVFDPDLSRWRVEDWVFGPIVGYIVGFIITSLGLALLVGVGFWVWDGE